GSTARSAALGKVCEALSAQPLASKSDPAIRGHSVRKVGERIGKLLSCGVVGQGVVQALDGGLLPCPRSLPLGFDLFGRLAFLLGLSGAVGAVASEGEEGGEDAHGYPTLEGQEAGDAAEEGEGLEGEGDHRGLHWLSAQHSPTTTATQMPVQIRAD